MPNRLMTMVRGGWELLRLSVRKFLKINGGLSAGAFAFDAFFALFPLIILSVTIASFFLDQRSAEKEVVSYIQNIVALSRDMKRSIFDTIAGVIESRQQAGVVALLLLVWSAGQTFTTLIHATNNAWGTTVVNWWRLPLKSLALLAMTVGALLLGIAAPVFLKVADGWLHPANGLRSSLEEAAGVVIPLAMVFIGLTLFYRLAPRRTTRFAEVWVASLCVTALLVAGESLFVIYLRDFATLNAVYGAFGGIMALLLWIYVSGCFLIFGACVCAAQAELRTRSGSSIGAKDRKEPGIKKKIV